MLEAVLISASVSALITLFLSKDVGSAVLMGMLAAGACVILNLIF